MGSIEIIMKKTMRNLKKRDMMQTIPVAITTGSSIPFAYNQKYYKK
jgi:hypothetical protein